jgi:uncharacterized protein YndB with AHSA1/START domain
MRRMKGVATALTLISITAAMSGQNTGPVIAEAMVDAPVEAVWKAWTTDEGLRSWLAPHASIDLCLGGLMRANYQPAGELGDAQTIEHTILSFEPDRMLSIKTTKTPQDFPFPLAIQRMWTVVYCEPQGASQTKVRVVSLGFGPDEESQRMRSFFDWGNTQTLEQLKKGMAAGPR